MLPSIAVTSGQIVLVTLDLLPNDNQLTGLEHKVC